MRSIPILPPLLLPALLASQTPPPDRPATLAYRGFALAATAAEFSARAQTLAVPAGASLICTTSRRTAQLMECGVPVRDPVDSAGFYVAAYVIEGRVAFLSFGDSGTATLVERTQRDLESRFGRPHASRAGMWEWRARGGHEVVRLTWRGRGAVRWIYIALWDEPLMDRISRYVPRTRR